MNALVPHTVGQSAVSVMLPRSMREAMDMAAMMATTTFLARELQNAGGAMFVMEQAMRWQMSPWAVAMETSFIQGKPMFSGKIVAAAIQTSGVLQGRLAYAYAGAGDDRTVTITGTLRGEAAPREVQVRVKDARTQNKVWATQTDQQLAYHGARVWARRHAPEVMLGVYAPEEFEPAPVALQHAGPTIDARPEPPASRPKARQRDAVDDDAIPALDEPPPGVDPRLDEPAEGVSFGAPTTEDKPRTKALALIARINACLDEDCLHEIAGDPNTQKGRDWMAKNRPELDAQIAEAFGTRYAALTTPAAPPPLSEIVPDEIPF